MTKTARRVHCMVVGHVYCPQAGDGWVDAFCQRCGERTLMFNRDHYVGDQLMSASEYRGLIMLAAFIVAAGLILSGELYFTVVGAALAFVVTIIRVVAMNDKKTEKTNFAWEFCDTPGCVLGKGHGGDCKMAKGR